MVSIIAQRAPLRLCYQANLALSPSVMLSNFNVMYGIKKKKKKEESSIWTLGCYIIQDLGVVI